MSFIFQQIGLFIQSVWEVWSLVWWIVLPLVAAIVYFEFKEHYKQSQFHHSIKWRLYEIKVPPNILKTPKAMEQIFAAAYLEGEKLWMSFEIVGRAGQSRFFLRVPQQFSNMMESAIYAQYPDAELAIVDDYVSEKPHEMPNAEFDLYGAEEVLGNSTYLPIRTYPFFEESVDERRIDTIALLMEAMGKLKDAEQLWFQLIVKPAGDGWRKEGEKAINKLLGIEEKHESHGGIFGGFSLGLTLGDILASPFKAPEGTSAHAKTEAPARRETAPGAKESVDGIRTKIGKLGFETTVRFCYIDKRASFAKDNVSSMQAFLRQFNDQRLNYFKPDPMTVTAGTTGYFKDRKLAFRKRTLYENYAHAHPRHAAHGSPQCILNIEELATIYHFPLGTVGTTQLQKVTSRKGGPPASLPLME